MKSNVVQAGVFASERWRARRIAHPSIRSNERREAAFQSSDCPRLYVQEVNLAAAPLHQQSTTVGQKRHGRRLLKAWRHDLRPITNAARRFKYPLRENAGAAHSDNE